MTTRTPALSKTITTFLFARKDDDPSARCAVTVASAVTTTFRGFRAAMRAIDKLVADGDVTRGNVGNWVDVLALGK